METQFIIVNMFFFMVLSKVIEDGVSAWID